MKATELRIGINIYYNDIFEIGDVDGTNLKVIKVNAATINWASNNIEQFNRAHKPIPLTEEWLVKFGFELKTKGSYNCYQNNKKFVICMWVEPYKIAGFEEQGTCYYGMEYKAIKYVNELQNLYFALIGEELTIKE